jgi:hypothetical protein
MRERRIKEGALFATFVFLATAVASTSDATIVDYRTAAVTHNPDSVVTTSSDGVVITASAYHVDFASSGPVVWGPFPTTPGNRSIQIFGVFTRNGSRNGLGLNAQPTGSLNPSENDVQTANFQPGFDNQTLESGADPGIQFAQITFSESVDVSQVIVGTQISAGDIWVAGGAGAVPDLSTDFLGALTTLGVQTSVDNMTGIQFVHDLTGLSNIDFLLIGTPPSTVDRAPLTAEGRAHFFIDGLNLVPTAVPEPGPVWLLLPALGMLGRRGRGHARNRSGTS